MSSTWHEMNLHFVCTMEHVMFGLRNTISNLFDMNTHKKCTRLIDRLVGG